MVIERDPTLSLKEDSMIHAGVVVVIEAEEDQEVVAVDTLTDRGITSKATITNPET